jgi:hypothetical protein
MEHSGELHIQATYNSMAAQALGRAETGNSGFRAGPAINPTLTAFSSFFARG